MNEAAFRFIVARIIQNAIEAKEAFDEDRNSSFQSGRSLAYYEVLDTLQSELEVHGANLEDYGIDMDLEKTFM